MKNIKEIIIDNEKVYLKKDFLGWRVVYPEKNAFNIIFGSKRNLFHFIIYLFIFLLFMLAINEAYDNCKAIIKNPCFFCREKINSIIANITYP